jgi:transposase
MILAKQSVGIDIAKLTFTSCVCKRFSDLNEGMILSEVKTFSNDKTGFNQLTKWVSKNIDKELPVSFAMEATGIYYEQLAYHLHSIGKRVSVLLPNKVAHFTKSLNIKTKTDDIDASVIAMMGCERLLKEWTPASPTYKRLRTITRLYQTLQGDKTQTINRLKGVECGFEPLEEAAKIHKNTIKNIEVELEKLISMMMETLKSDEEIWAKVENLMTIKGIGFKTAALVLAETQGFALIKNQRQLVSYCGFDVIKRESGTSIKGRTRISKKGNSRLRAAMYMPSMTAIRYNPKMKEIYERINKDKSVKSIGLVAVQRRLLVLMYSLWKKNEAFDENYGNEMISDIHEEEVPSSSSTRRVETESSEEKVDGAKKHPSTQNEHLHNHLSEVLLHQEQIS